MKQSSLILTLILLSTSTAFAAGPAKPRRGLAKLVQNIVSGQDLECSISAMKLSRMGAKAKPAIPILIKKARERKGGPYAPGCPSAAAHAIKAIAPKDSKEYKEAKQIQEKNWE
jgi:hypothetical protein